MNEQDHLKALMIAHTMASADCSFEEAELVYAEFERTVFRPTITLVTGMIVRKVRRELFGVDTIANN